MNHARTNDNPAPASDAGRNRITESPWFWVHLFANFGLVLLVVIGPKFTARQAHIEDNLQRRQRAAQLHTGQAQVDPPSHANAASEFSQNEGIGHEASISLTPFYILLGSAIVVSWIALWRTRLRQPAGQVSTEAKESIT